MARPKPTLLTSHDDLFKTVDVILVNRFWAITYQGQLISVRHKDYSQLNTGIKYRKTCFPTQAVATQMAAKLNQMFMTEDFDIKEIR